ncbi:SDR family oxidoreductase [Actinophytocola sp.]|uniref:SDR family oxidoreductase n=1 Tax=Actinophytocola sp. TaxID=1872138 RepID=UPI0039C89B62
MRHDDQLPDQRQRQVVGRLVEQQVHLPGQQASPIRRLLAPEEVAPAIAFLRSPANTAVTGEPVRVSGGPVTVTAGPARRSRRAAPSAGSRSAGRHG